MHLQQDLEEREDQQLRRQHETGEDQEADDPAAAEMVAGEAVRGHRSRSPVTRMTALTTVTVLFQK
jgi:hypothetical protein